MIELERILRSMARIACETYLQILESQARPLWMAESVWAELSATWSSPDYSRKRDQNRQNRASDVGGLGSSLHTGGSVPHTEHRRRLEEYTRIRESQTAAGEGSSGGSTEYSDYRTWSQAVGGMQHDRVYGLGSQAYIYEGQTSSGCSFSSSTQESLYTQQIITLTAELEHVRKAHGDWQKQIQQPMEIQQQMQIQQTQMLEEMQRMREQMSSGKSTAAEEETDSD
ncbi:hypothetical protein IEQ34_015715 [Dendrobium chrysotoxum]|uniref:Uncharacterized protein n=1 Tax=Dendrobium chrysotoxum TaxID=161865 RepID=A0AAV7GJ04_DENCH|nr:hypothetical protein IEQ34_015715 [Dendrobium chrysotoxum]